MLPASCFVVEGFELTEARNGWNPKKSCISDTRNGWVLCLLQYRSWAKSHFNSLSRGLSYNSFRFMHHTSYISHAVLGWKHRPSARYLRSSVSCAVCAQPWETPLVPFFWESTKFNITVALTWFSASTSHRCTSFISAYHLAHEINS